jgi:SH3-like domain-containing protein
VPVPPAITVECTVTVRSLRLRAGPTTEAAVIIGLANGQPLTASAHNPESSWLAVRTPEGASGWVAAEFVSCAQPIDTLPVATAAPATP